MLNCEVVADTKLSETHEKIYSASGYQTIEIKNEAGNIQVETNAIDSIYIEYDKICYSTNDDEALQGIKDIEVSIDCDSTEGVISISTFVEVISDINEYQVDFYLSIPENILCDLSNDIGEIKLNGLANPPILSTGSGDITLEHMKCGIKKLNSRWGNIDCSIDTLCDSSKVVISTVYGSQTIHILSIDTTVNADLNLTSQHGSIKTYLLEKSYIDFDLKTSSVGEVSVEGFDNISHGEKWLKRHKIGTIGNNLKNGKFRLRASSETGNVKLRPVE